VKHRGVDLIQFHPKQIWQELQVTMEHRHSEYVRHLRFIEFEYEQLAQVCTLLVLRVYNNCTFYSFDKTLLYG
jgi:hypothetical protein